MIPTSALFDQSTIAALLEHDPLVQEYRTFFSLFDWSVVDQWQALRSSRGRPAHPMSAYLKAFLIRIHHKFIYASELRHFLVTHPLLILELGFRLVLDPSTPYGFDIEKTLPCRYWFCHMLRNLDQSLLQSLLHATVTALQAEIPGLGETVAFDVKHIYAWVKENNERVYVAERYDKDKRLVGDPDCRLGVKRSSNQEEPEARSQAEATSPSPQKKKKPAPTEPASNQIQEPEKEKKERIWGYGSGVAAATHPTYGDVVLAQYTQPFNEGDATYFRLLYQQAVLALSRFPTNVTADAAFDAQVASTKPLLVRGGLLPFLSTTIRRPNAIPMPFRAVLLACECI